MHKIIDRLLELESKATKGPWDQEMFGTYCVAVGPECRRPFQAVRDQDLINMMRNNIRPLLLRMKALEEVAEAAREYWNKYNSDCENSELIKAENRLEFLLTKVNEARQG
jgi:hypothetical protein